VSVYIFLGLYEQIGSEVDGASRPIALAEAKPVGFAAGGEGEPQVRL